ncbi:Gfo/Idh/MocA family protein [Gryllotalpicola reticulitermitis]|uniref:Gfo/Idh/MocA family protein n=1 Tax=Gryllotalpicola reticulitermitis TaxID=1184153 RepID=A0ABV8QAJ4_9MICO
MSTQSDATTRRPEAPDRIGVAMVGCGVIGRTHVAAIEAIDELELVAVVDPIESAREAFADAALARTGSRPAVYAELDEALADPRVGMVSVGTPSGMHIRQGLAALAAGRHVVIEKPLDASLEHAAEIEAAAAAAAERGIVASVISQHRFDSATRAVADAISSGRLGRVTSALATSPRWRTQEYYDSGEWRGTWEFDGGGALMNQGVHTLDVLLALMGRPVEISARTALLAHERVEVEDTMVATIEFESGALGMMHASTAAYPGLESRVQIMGSGGSAIIENDELVYLTGHEAGGESSAGAPAPAVTAPGDARQLPEGHIRQYRDVLRAIRTGTAPGVPVSAAAIALCAVRAVYISATLGRPVLFDDVRAGRYADVEVRTGR